MKNGERATGVPDQQYDLLSVLYHALQGGETSQTAPGPSGLRSCSPPALHAAVGP